MEARARAAGPGGSPAGGDHGAGDNGRSFERESGCRRTESGAARGADDPRPAGRPVRQDHRLRAVRGRVPGGVVLRGAGPTGEVRAERRPGDHRARPAGPGDGRGATSCSPATIRPGFPSLSTGWRAPPGATGPALCAGGGGTSTGTTAARSPRTTATSSLRRGGRPTHRSRRRTTSSPGGSGYHSTSWRPIRRRCSRSSWRFRIMRLVDLGQLSLDQTYTYSPVASFAAEGRQLDQPLERPVAARRRGGDGRGDRPLRERRGPSGTGWTR